MARQTTRSLDIKMVDKKRIASGVIKARLLRRPAPLMVVYEVTHLCTQCWCARVVEENYLWGLKFRNMLPERNSDSR